MYQAIVFLPLLGAILAGIIALVGAHARFPGGPPVDTGHGHAAVPHAADHAHAAHDEHAPVEPPAVGSYTAELITTTLLFIAMVLSWIALWRVGFGHQDARDADHAVHRVRRSQGRLGDPGRCAHRRHAGRGDDGVGARPPLFDRLHGGRPVPAAVLRLPLDVHLRHADAGDGGQPRAAVLRLGGRRAGELSPDRLLVPEARRPTPRRSRPSSSTASAISVSRSASSRCS